MTSQRPKSRGRAIGVVAAAIMIVSVIAGCSSGTTTSGDSTPTAKAPSDSAISSIPGIDQVPASAQKNYEGAQHFVKLQPDAYANWTPPKGPTTWCMSESYTGNSWRKEHVAEFQKLVSGLKADGKATSDLRVTDSNSNTALQISQVNTLVNSGCNVLILMAGSPDALCNEVASAQAKGVLVLTSDAAVDCPDLINVSFNGYTTMKDGTDAVAKAIGKKGSVLIVSGVAGTAASATEQAAIDSALPSYPNIKVVGNVVGNWTPSVAQSAVATFLSTHPAKIDGILEFGEMGVGAERAFAQAGRTPPPITTASSGECAAFAYWKAHPKAMVMAAVQAPDAAAYETYQVAMRMLAGQKPKLNTLLYPIPEVTSKNFNEFYKSSMTESSTCYPRSADGRAVPDSYFDDFFTGGKPVTTQPTS